ncbi:anti-phage deoxyguanosine triphosphatase, partial [Pseudoalteromonas tunicata]|uniref:anti-phage deoxyguanosine triphosphatase n=1 Tax=Pseudoalteromonas tunicata TaxID=314281 RepID=UPI00273E5F9C
MDHWTQRRFDEIKLRPDDQRTAYQKDRARIIHAAAFRRLQAKTQIMGIGVDDFYRTRLTHSLEVAQIGSGILGQLRSKNDKPDFLPCRSLIETLCLAHDIGHPPFGHGGEIALNFMMREHGGFEGNGQTLRIVSKLEPYTDGYGMNLTRRTLLGFIKYPQIINTLWHTQPRFDPNAAFIKSADWLPAKGVYQDDDDVFDWILSALNKADQQKLLQFKSFDQYRHKTLFKSLDCSIMELADDIAYAVHDLEDAIATGTVTEHHWYELAMPKLKDNDHPWLKAHLARISASLFSRQQAIRKDAIGELVNLFITQAQLQTIDTQFESPLLKHNVLLPEGLNEFLSSLKSFVYQTVIRKPEMQQIEFKGQKLIIDLFSAFASDPERLLPRSTQAKWRQAQLHASQGHRIICDYIAGMTDEYAYKTHQRLFCAP